MPTAVMASAVHSALQAPHASSASRVPSSAEPVSHARTTSAERFPPKEKTAQASIFAPLAWAAHSAPRAARASPHARPASPARTAKLAAPITTAAPLEPADPTSPSEPHAAPISATAEAPACPMQAADSPVAQASARAAPASHSPTAARASPASCAPKTHAASPTSAQACDLHRALGRSTSFSVTRGCGFAFTRRR